MNEIRFFLEGTMQFEDLEFVEETEFGYEYVGYKSDTDEEYEITVEYGNRVYVDGEEVDVDMPFNVWSL